MTNYHNPRVKRVETRVQEGGYICIPLESKKYMNKTKIHISKNGIKYTHKKPIKRNKKTIGWWLYSSYHGILGADKFMGYMWK